MSQSVVLVSEAADGKGGASLAALNSALILARAGLHVRFFAGTGPFCPPEPAPANLQAMVLTDGVDLVRAPLLKRATQSLWNETAADRFAAFVADLDPASTIVHVHTFQHQLTGSVVRMASDLGFPVVFTAHDYGLACPYSGFYHNANGAPCGKRALSLGCATTLCTEGRSVPGKAWHLAKGLTQRGPGQVPKAFRHVAFVSEFSRQILRPYLPERTPTSIVRNPIPIEPGPPRVLQPEAPFLYVGRLTREKGVVTLARAAGLAKVPVEFIGTGEMADSVKEANSNAVMLGWLSPGEVRERMRAARALVFPSQWYETQGMTVVEAQAVGLPIIVACGCAATEAVRDGEDGYHFEPGNVEDLARKLLQMDDQTATRMGLAAHQKLWANPPTPELHLEQTLAMYDSVLGART